MKLLRSLATYAYAPFLLLFVNGYAIYMVKQDQPKLLLLALFLATLGGSFLIERLIPYNESWNSSHDDQARDAAHGVVNEGLNYVTLLVLPALTLVLGAEGLWPHQWPFALQVAVSLLVLDAGITLCHFASHKIEVLWRLHAVHHSVKRMYSFNGLMKHPLHQILETSAGSLPLVLLGLPLDVAIALVFCVSIQLLLQHSNADYRIGPFKYLLATNEVHRFHHQKWAGIGDVNFGLVTNIWDHLLGTFQLEEREMFTSDELGIGKEPDYPNSYLQQLARPFASKRDTTEQMATD